MTRAAQVTQAMSAMRDARATPSSLPDPPSMAFLVYEDNGGDYHWTLLGRDGTSLARSGSFASYERTEDAARVVLAGVGSARLDPRAATDSSVETPQ